MDLLEEGSTSTIKPQSENWMENSEELKNIPWKKEHILH